MLMNTISRSSKKDYELCKKVGEEFYIEEDVFGIIPVNAEWEDITINIGKDNQ